MADPAPTPVRRRNVYDKAVPVLVHLDPAGFIRWATTTEARFHSWQDSRHRTGPDEPGLISDLIAGLAHADAPDPTHDLVIEIESHPRADETERLRDYTSSRRRTLRLAKTPRPVFAVVVNLRGTTRPAAIDDLLPGDPRARDLFSVIDVDVDVDVDVAKMKASDALGAIDAGRTSANILGFVPLMRGGRDRAIIARWREVAGRAADEGSRGTIAAMAVVLAELKHLADAWKPILEGTNMLKSRIIEEWTAEARAEGKAETLRESIGMVVRAKFGRVPMTVSAAVKGEGDTERLFAWLQLAATATDLATIREAISAANGDAHH